MDALFSPQSVVIIGASNTNGNLGTTIISNLKEQDCSCNIYAVNKDGADVLGYRGFSSVENLPDSIDLAVMITSAKMVPYFAEECGKKNIKMLIIESAGFSEDGGKGIEHQNQLDQICQKYGIRYIGPNCLGTVDSSSKFFSFYGVLPGMYDEIFKKPGSASYVIQSGGIAALIIDSFQTDVGNINKVVSIGNKADLDESDFIDYYNTDKSKVIGIYLESINDGRKLMDSARKSKIPILLFKVGRTEAGAKAAQSHTSGMASNDRIFDSACKQAGIIRCESVSELYSMPKIFTEMPLLKGKKIAIVTNSGAFGGISSDLLFENGLEIAKLSTELQKKLHNSGKLYNASNPIDLGPAMSKELFLSVYETLLKSDEIDGILAIPNVWIPVIIDSTLDLVQLCKKHEKPAAIYIPNSVDRILDIRKNRGVPSFLSVEESVRALSISLQHYRYQSKKEAIK
jgi:acyl-CoA synthetase (NDP forming)